MNQDPTSKIFLAKKYAYYIPVPLAYYIRGNLKYFNKEIFTF